MNVIKLPSEMQNWSRSQKMQGKNIGLVPTMGMLHEGHLSLVRLAKEKCDLVVVSIFVNPIQFGEGEDFESYPRDFSRDSNLLEKEGVDVVFAPEGRDMYTEDFGSSVETSGLDTKLCGKSRPGHFRGVTTVVSKLFNICLPDLAVFGQKDAQQVMIIEKMVKDLNFPLQILRGPIVREPNGLAMSSRNTYLNEREREDATILSRSLTMAKNLIDAGERNPSAIKGAMIEAISQVPGTRIDYIEVLNGVDLSDLKEIKGKVLIALAVKFGGARLIDNVLVEV